MQLTKVRKLLTFTLAAGLLMSSMTVSAVPKDQWPTTFPGTYTGKDGTTGGIVSDYKGSDHYYHFYGSEPGSSAIRGADEYLWLAENGNDYQWDKASNSWALISSGSGSSKSGSSKSSGSKSGSSGSSHKKTAAEKEAEERKKAEEAARREAQERADREALAQKQEAEEGGFGDVEDMLDADGRDMSAAEWNNNAILNTPGMDLSLPVSAGQGSVVIGGEKTNITPAMEKADAAFADSVSREKDGILLNVFQVSYPSTDEADITFDLPGVNEDSEITAYQYVSGVWKEVDVTEIRKDHVTLHLQGDGVIAFMLKPSTSFNWNRREGIAEWDYPNGEEERAAAEKEGSAFVVASGTLVIPEQQPVETPAKEPDPDKKDDKADAPADQQPVIEKVTHWHCACGFDTTDKNAFKQHALEGVRKGENHSYHNWDEEVEVNK